MIFLSFSSLEHLVSRRSFRVRSDVLMYYIFSIGIYPIQEAGVLRDSCVRNDETLHVYILRW